MSSIVGRLFAGARLEDKLSDGLENARKAVEGIQKDQFLTSSADQIVKHIAPMLELHQLVLHEEQKQLTTDETEIDVSHDTSRYFSAGSRPVVRGTLIMVEVPFSGRDWLWQFRTNPHAGFPKGTILKNDDGLSGVLVLHFELPYDNATSEARRMLDTELGEIRRHLDWSAAQVSAYNSALEATIRSAVQERRERLARHGDLPQVLEIPLQRNPAAPSLTPVPVRRRWPEPLPRPEHQMPEMGITDESYEQILAVIRHEGRTFESAPGTFSRFMEEELRNIMLAHLNGHFLSGKATAETFRGRGKTDIRIEESDRSAFISEAKIWSGQKALADALTQLLSYHTWRDSKAALIIFNKKVAAFSEVPSKAVAALRDHPLFVAEQSRLSGGEYRLLARSPDDEGHQITIHVFVLNLYTRPQQATK